MDRAYARAVAIGGHSDRHGIYVFRRGYYRARTDIYTQLFTRRLGRTLTEGETATLSQRIETLGVDRLDDVLFDLSPDALAAWLANPKAR